MNTIKFLFKSLVQNTCILLEKQKWWLALIVLLTSLVICVSPTLSTGYTSNVATYLNTSKDAAIDKGLAKFALDINDENSVVIENNTLTSTGIFAPLADLTSESAASTVYQPNKSYTHIDGDKSITVLRTYFLNLDSTNSQDLATLTSFRNVSILKSGSSTSTTAKEIQSSYIIFTNNAFYIYIYQAKGATLTTNPLVYFSGVFTEEAFKAKYDLATMKTIAETTNNDKAIEANWVKFFNEAYAPVNVRSTWISVGTYLGIDFAVIFFSGLIFFLFSRGKNSIKHYSFLEAEKIASFMALTPAVISAVVSVFMSQFGIFIFLVAIAFRMMSAVSKLNGNNSSSSSGPVYKARS